MSEESRGLMDSDERFSSLLAQLVSCECGQGESDHGAEGEHVDCHSVIEHLFEFVDREMPVEIEHVMADHAYHCDSCGSAVSTELKVREMVKRSCESHAPEGLRERVLSLMVGYAQFESEQ